MMPLKSNHIILTFAVLTCFSTFNSPFSTVFAQGTAFTYHGRLTDGANPATGTYDLRFAIYDAGTNGNLVGGPDTNSATGVTNGLFCVTLDFGSGVFNGSPRWLEIAARTNGAAEFTALAPRQAVMPVPYALYASSAGSAAGVSGGVSASQISGTLALTQLPGAVLTNNEQGVSLTGSLTGNLIGNATTAGTATSATSVVASDGTPLLTVTGTNYTGHNTNSIYFTSAVAVGIFGSAQVFQWSASIAAYTNGSDAGEYYELTQGRWQITNSIHPATNSPFIYTGPGTISATNPVSNNWRTNGNGLLAGVFPSFGTNGVPVYSLGNAVTVGTASNMVAFSQDETNLDNTAWMYFQAARLGDNQNAGRYDWTNAINKLRAGKTIRIEVDGTGLMALMFQYCLSPLKNTLGQPAGMFNDICYGGGGLAGIFWPGPNNNFTWTWNSYVGYDTGLDSTWFAGALLFTNVQSAINIGVANPMPYPWDTVEVDYYLFTNGATFKVQTNNNAGGSWGDVSGTISAKALGTNTASWFWTNTLGAQQLGIQITNLSAGTNIILSVGAWNSTITNGFIVGLQLHAGSFNADELKPPSNCVATVYQSWNPDLILWENYNTTNVLQTILPGWAAFYKNAVPNAGIVLCGTYPTLSIDQTAPNQYIRNIALLNGFAYFDGQTPFESTNTIFARGLAMPGDDPHFAGCWPLWGCWLYRWLDLQDFYLQGGLPGANAITSGITTNILVDGHTFYYTNGILMSIQ